MDKDHYEILGITRNASEAEIGTAYRKLALKYHPDKNKAPDAALKFRRLTDAYNVLSDKERRKVYDRIFKKDDCKRDATGDGNQTKNESSARFEGKANKDTSFGFGSGRFGPGSTNKPFAGPSGRAQNPGFARSGTPSGGGTFGGRDFAGRSTKYQHGPGFSAPYSPSPDPFQKGTANSRTPGSAEKTQMKQNPPVEHDLYVTLHEVFRGCTKKMKITRTVMSRDGRTSKREEKIFEIYVKPGCKAGTKVTFHREGDQIPGTIPADIVFVIRDAPHPQFKREGANLLYTAKVTPQQIIDGRVITAPTLTGDKETVVLNVTVFCGAVMKYQGHGFPRPEDPRSRGDLHVSFEIMSPDPMRKNYSQVPWGGLL